mmetsp:Transcript_19888/g.18901  ORF Transcript_19888/g.18901 Transcript_19888/m.18901 type:complete len:96 (+) Transcript_19888:501-788(+)|eukprot:CAMPEP_0170545602 /NCGR_PEP_ID=MMETSP0211-20121228/3980_1 /TAXON_ID=311385 /ORGANISM="Pseudokeronopsis sp., Strain OXSARD2" /LENGTH=95 /DNA_ID=CAMNT_0010849599 /DNA_START=500 /DNA_END=787 /DNA_ORIENTATION=+
MCKKLLQRGDDCLLNNTYYLDCEPGYKCMKPSETKEPICKELYVREPYKYALDPDFCIFPYIVEEACANVTNDNLFQNETPIEFPFICLNESLPC